MNPFTALLDSNWIPPIKLWIPLEKLNSSVMTKVFTWRKFPSVKGSGPNEAYSEPWSRMSTVGNVPPSYVRGSF